MLVWDIFFVGMESLFMTRNDSMPSFLNVSMQNHDGKISRNGHFRLICGKGIHSVYTLDKNLDLVKSTSRAGITLSKLTLTLRLISRVKNVNGSTEISPLKDFRSDALEWIKLFQFRHHIRASALLESAAEAFSTLVRSISSSNVDFHWHLEKFQKHYFSRYEILYCENCTDGLCPINSCLDTTVERMGQLIDLIPTTELCLADVLGAPVVETFVERNFDESDDFKFWNSKIKNAFGFSKKLLFGFRPRSSPVSGPRPAPKKSE